MRYFTIMLVLMLFGVSAVLAADGIVLRSSVKPESAWLGQRVILQVDVLGSDGWTQITRFDDIEIPGAYLMRTDSQGTRLRETIDGTSYSGQRYEFSIYPQTAGTIEVPSMTVEATTKAYGADAGDRVQQAQVPAVTLQANIPDGAENVRGLISTTELNAQQGWQSSDEALQVGDALERTISMQAVDVSGMAFTPLEHADIPGVGIYPSQADVEDSSNRGTLNGSRTEAVTYVFELPGEVQIPDIEFSWWNLADEKLEQVTLPGRVVQVAAGPGSASGGGALSPRQLQGPTLLPLVVVLLILAAALYYYREPLTALWKSWLAAREESERMYFRRVAASVRQNDSAATLRDTMRWLDRINDASTPAQLASFFERYGGAGATEAIDQLLRNVAAGSRLTDSNQLLEVLSTARGNWRRARKQRQTAANELPALNPE